MMPDNHHGRCMVERAYMPDYLRLFALFGIVVVNIQAIAYPLTDGFFGATRSTPIDAIVVWLVNGLGFLKTYGFFSFMFGVGLAFQIRSAERRSLPFGQLYRNRMIGLFLLGFLHGCLLFPFDVLVLYSIIGAILYLMRDWSVRNLVKASIVLLTFQIIIASALFLAQQPMEDVARTEREIMSGGDFIDVTVFRTIAFATTLPFLLILQGFSALGWFCLGLAAVKSGLIDAPDHHLWVAARRWCLGTGVALSLLAAGIWQCGAADVGMLLTVACAPVATMGYLGLIAAVARRKNGFEQAIAPCRGFSGRIRLAPPFQNGLSVVPAGADDALLPLLRDGRFTESLRRGPANQAAARAVV